MMQGLRILCTLCCMALALPSPQVLAAMLPESAAPYSIVDDTGETIRLEAPAARIIPLYGTFTEILLSMDLGERLIARTAADAQTPGLEHLPGIGTHIRPNLEMVVGMGPDLVLQLGGRNEALESVHALRRLGIRTAFFRVSSFEELFALIEKIGILTGETNRAEDMASSLKQRLTALDTALEQSAERPSVFFELRYPRLIAAGSGSMVTAIIERAGGRNCLAVENDAAGRVIRINEEELLRLDPDWYLIQQGPMNKNPQPAEERQHYGSLSAVRHGRTKLVDETAFSRPGPRNIQATEELAQLLHPECFGEAGARP